MSNTFSLRDAGILDARVPRYTSYPPANHFTPQVDGAQMMSWISQMKDDARVSLYLHIPFCRRLCNFCACHTQGTLTARPLMPYLEHLLCELSLVDAALPVGATLSRVHLGGGTPTILPPDLIRTLGTAIRAVRPLSPRVEISAEIDPTEFSPEVADALLEIDLTRASIGVQDFDPLVQEAIGRIQSFEVTREAVRLLRQRGISSINMDLLYGLPHQTPTRMLRSLEKVIALQPERIALYGYAHVPWVAKRQKLIPEHALPSAAERVALFELARQVLLGAGYVAIGIDHFALPHDSLTLAAREGRLHRNFQGYTDENADALIGLGASAISKMPQGYAQNAPSPAEYARAVEAGKFATIRGHAFSGEDKLRGEMIEELMCDFTLDVAAHAARAGISEESVRARLQPMFEAYGDYFEPTENGYRLIGPQVYLARLVAHCLDDYSTPVGHHAPAI